MAEPPVGPEVTIDLVVPTYNEEAVLEPSIRRLDAYLHERLPFTWRILIADNGSTDRTRAIADELAEELEAVTSLRITAKGRGLALREAWTGSSADVVAYVDVDLSTGLTGLLPLVAPIVSGHSEIAIGSRLSDGALVARGPRREIISRVYNSMLRALFAVRFRDAQCGFKAVRADVARRLVPAIENDAWFFDTELLLLAEHNGLRIHEVPVDWIDDPDSRVDVRATAMEDIRGMARVLWTLVRGGGRVDLGDLARPPLVDDFGRQTVTFASIGLASTFATVVAYVVLRGALDPVLATVMAVGTAGIFNAWANRRWTFRRRAPAATSRHVSAALLVFVVPLLVSLGALAVAGGELVTELVALVAAWTLTGMLRFLVLRRWVYRR